MVKCRDHVESFFINFTYAMKFLNNSRIITTENHFCDQVAKIQKVKTRVDHMTRKAISAVCNVSLFLDCFFLQYDGKQRTVQVARPTLLLDGHLFTTQLSKDNECLYITRSDTRESCKVTLLILRKHMNKCVIITTVRNSFLLSKETREYSSSIVGICKIWVNKRSISTCHAIPFLAVNHASSTAS